MVMSIKSVGHGNVKTFTLDNPQPVKDPFFMLFPIDGNLEIRSLKGNGLTKKHITVRSYRELKSLLG